MSDSKKTADESRAEVIKALRASMEGALALGQLAQSMTAGEGSFSKSTGSYHSKGGNDFSKAAKLTMDELKSREEARMAFAKEFLKRTDR